MRTLELRRHARRDPTADRLSPEGRAQAREVGAGLAGGYARVWVSPAARAAETAAWFLGGPGERPPEPGVAPGLGGQGTDGSPAELGRVVLGLLQEVPEGGRGLAVGHTPLIERATLGLTGREIEPLAECEGVELALEGTTLSVGQLRLR